MAIKSTSRRYGTVAIVIHWTTAALILALIILGLNADEAEGPAKSALLIPHIVLGIATLLLTLVRIGWWVFADKRPAAHPGVSSIQSTIATIVHFLAYGFIIALAVTGIVTNITGGVIDAIAAGAPIPDLDTVPARGIHGALAWSFMALLAIHIGAALYHHFVRRDGLLSRMGVGQLPG